MNFYEPSMVKLRIDIDLQISVYLDQQLIKNQLYISATMPFFFKERYII